MRPIGREVGDGSAQCGQSLTSTTALFAACSFKVVNGVLFMQKREKLGFRDRVKFALVAYEPIPAVRPMQ